MIRAMIRSMRCSLAGSNGPDDNPAVIGLQDNAGPPDIQRDTTPDRFLVHESSWSGSSAESVGIHRSVRIHGG